MHNSANAAKKRLLTFRRPTPTSSPCVFVLLVVARAFVTLAKFLALKEKRERVRNQNGTQNIWGVRTLPTVSFTSGWTRAVWSAV